MIDPGEESALFLARLASEGWALRGIWLTHGHLDHVAGVGPVVDGTGAEVWLHPEDRWLYDRAEHQGRQFGVSIAQPPAPDHELRPGETMTIGRFGFKVRHVPGHSPGSVAFIGHGVAIAGDALFAGSVGRVDLPGGHGPTLLRSIETELLTLEDDTIVYAGHGPETTIGAERRTNPFLTGAYPLV